MYRQNKLKEELDRLREENERLRNECTFWKGRVETERELNRSLQYEMQLNKCSYELTRRIMMPQPIEIKVSSDPNESFQKFIDKFNDKKGKE